MQNSITSLSHVGLIQVSGPDAKTFLQGIITCNMNMLSSANSLLAAHCNLKGRIHSLFRVSQLAESSYLLSLPLSMIPITLASLKKYALFSNVTIEEANYLDKIGYCGEELRLNDTQTHRVALPGGPSSRFEVYGEKDIIANLRTRLAKEGITQASDLQWENWDIQAGLPTVFPATVDSFLPHHLNLIALGGISLDKGCYLGQEIVARMHYKGNIKKHMYRAQATLNERIPQPNDTIAIEGKSLKEMSGTVVRAITHSNQVELLVVIEDELAHTNITRLYDTEGPVLTYLPLSYESK